MAHDPATPTPTPTPTVTVVGAAADATLAGFRASIDNLDAALIHILAERFRITKAVGAHKAARGLPASDPGREAEQIARLRRLAVEAQLDPDFGEKLLRFIIEEVIRHHHSAQHPLAQHSSTQSPSAQRDK